MSKLLVVCCDGTWNTPDELRGGRLTPTNVTKTALAVAPTDLGGREQRVFYHRGVGTSPGEHLVGGMFGYGLGRDVQETYRFLVQNFQPGDELFFFGFSRGAYTARSTVGFVRNAGILRPENADRLDDAYDLYRDRSNATCPRAIESTLFRRSYSYETRIRFIGVWDTVGAYGIPVTGVPFAKLFNKRLQFHDTALSSYVDAAFQALAIDEQRGPFRPTLWSQQDDPPAHQQVEQVWFSGVHSNIGGGYPDHELSDIPLLWMVNRARSCGLAFSPDAFPHGSSGSAPLPDDATMPESTSVHPNPLGLLENSRTGFYRLIAPFRRPIGLNDPRHEYASSTAVERHDQVPDYAPPRLVAYLRGNHQVMPVD
ncbi:DUF2235 domain-containing protein [Mycobacterium sp. CBMA293]|uniref:DUF2235 domain-containing protein n=2 Tax=Mycolicibacterium TaxID=1866885 RepID=UPI0012DD090E|nr:MULTISPECIES: DUF2235 domain-containing protein [unclassified Mycolicibacterium]MUL48782.1 DUF2235 domain-containing protein [Mycolicibacterium sp. CBMA 360]MUL62237.1 DUF2235 domain-containing protein [Mycolicibacterium sp. CBMA 335]MUL71697.1 DUF2235 domain-containing protein [Mycolicibacterium sp. CBMA 311]MUL93652.1 DUF2235 domain-containing protein [Mycolicibacterium sp. CBMA 230]MUM09335.1 hypothetical protein [Mycolicibacterium sp. CBMA 213]